MTTASATQQTKRRFAGRSQAARRIGIRIAVVVVAALIWEAIARLTGTLFFPPLSAILVRAHEMWFSGPPAQLFVTDAFLGVLLPSLQRLLPALVIAIVAGIAIGLAIGLVGWVSDLLYPLVHFIRSIPPSAKLPLFIILLGISNEMKIWLIVVTVALPLVINVVDGVRSTEPILLDGTRIFGISRTRTVFSVVLPSALPKIFAGLRLTTMIALIVLVLEEMLASSDGIGFFLLYSQRQFRLLDMWTAVLLISVLGYLLSTLVDFAEHRMLTWHRNARAGAR